MYAPCNRADINFLWSLLVIKNNSRSQEEWCIVGDFNEVLSRDERICGGDNCYFKGMEEFRGFMEQMELVDINCVRGKFTWFKDNGKVMSRINRFLLSRKLIEDWAVIDQRIDRRDISDHTPIRLNVGRVDWGPKPFRFNNTWFKHDGFKEFVEVEWKKLSFKGKEYFFLYEKLKSLRARLRVWNREVFDWIDLKVEEETDKINEFDKLIVASMGGNIDSLVLDRSEASKELWNFLNIQECMLRLKSLNLMLKDGKQNSRFFYRSIKERQERNAITSLEGKDGRVEGVDNIKEEVKNYFLNFG